VKEKEIENTEQVINCLENAVLNREEGIILKDIDSCLYTW